MIDYYFSCNQLIKVIMMIQILRSYDYRSTNNLSKPRSRSSVNFRWSLPTVPLSYFFGRSERYNAREHAQH